MQVKTTMRCHLIPIQMAFIKKISDTNNWQRYEGKGTCVHSGVAIIGNNIQIPWRIWKVANGLLIPPPEYLYPKKTYFSQRESIQVRLYKCTSMFFMIEWVNSGMLLMSKCSVFSMLYKISGKHWSLRKDLWISWHFENMQCF